jgi:hypothetical protein
VWLNCVTNRYQKGAQGGEDDSRGGDRHPGDASAAPRLQRPPPSDRQRRLHRRGESGVAVHVEREPARIRPLHERRPVRTVPVLHSFHGQGRPPRLVPQAETRVLELGASARPLQRTLHRRRSRPQLPQHQADGHFRLFVRRESRRQRPLREAIRTEAGHGDHLPPKQEQTAAVQPLRQVHDQAARQRGSEEDHHRRLPPGEQVRTAAVFVLEQQEGVLDIAAGEGVHEADGRLRLPGEQQRKSLKCIY